MSEKWKNKLRIKSNNIRIFLAELTGTFLLIAFGDGSVAQSVLSKKEFGDSFAINWGYGLAVTMGVYVSAGISGGHLNPAVTLAMAISGKLKWIKVPIYMIAQYLGAFLGALFVYLIYYDALMDYTDGNLIVDGPKATAGIWATYPSKFLSQGNGFGDQVFGTFLLLLCVRGITDERNSNVPAYLAPLLIGLLVVNIGISFGFNCGYAINPARDLGPRIFTAMCGYGADVFSASNYWFYVPVVATHIGGILGSVFYDLLIGLHWPDA